MSTDESSNPDLPGQDQLERAFEYYPRLKKVKEYVEEHLDEPIESSDAAHLVSLQPKSFLSFFRAHTGITFAQWLHSIRIKQAQAILDAEYIPIGTVASRVGYSNYRTFVRAFKRITGMNPSDYRKITPRN